MAEDAVDEAVKSGKLNPANKCLTYNLQLIGADGWDPAAFTVLAQQYVRMKRSHAGKVIPGAMDTAAAKHLSHAYGALAERVAAIAQVHFLHSSNCSFFFWFFGYVFVLTLMHFMLSASYVVHCNTIDSITHEDDQNEHRKVFGKICLLIYTLV